MIVRVHWPRRDGTAATMVYHRVKKVEETEDRLVIEQALVTTYLFTKHMRGWDKEDTDENSAHSG